MVADAGICANDREFTALPRSAFLTRGCGYAILIG
jgi:hypothetical protein